ncbi:hypothetical protein DCS32_09135 [Dokdonia sp. Dokd-P16]|uniref:hypothetical protein n=1 Tax=Dokdonia sp. Dokd-P16 TaxID=2173169 RepID=UPI000D54A784|nr:hypothetical protein [Dokdonia sp. Dokd-P16]AWH74317.1 hypothetical protein DCS32_09135 [Dokdonia sp. Dokd-P16]
MKTLYITLLSILITSQTFSQDYIASNGNKLTSTSRLSTSLSSFTIEVIDDDSFNYTQFLSESKESKSVYRVDGKQISKKELVKIFRKASRKSNEQQEFNKYLATNYSSIYSQLTPMELKTLYSAFSEKRIATYLSSLPSIL